MRIKKVSILYCGLAFVFVVFLIYWNIDYTNNGQLNSSKLSEEISAKIYRIENSLNSNKKTLDLIKKFIADSIKSGGSENLKALHERLNQLEKLTGDGDSLDIYLAQNRININNEDNIRLLPDMCPQDEAATIKSTISKLNTTMMQIYEELKFDDIDGGAWKQGFPITYDANRWNQEKLKVIVVPHSHQDPGWIKTYETYFQSETKLVLDSMLRKLTEYKDLTFIYAEIAFFSMWWDTLNQNQRSQVKKLIENGQLELATGGWVMTDEANAHYHAMIDQLIEGQEWMKSNIGVKPTAGWSIDPFGQSPTMSYLLRKMGVKHMLIQRVHYEVKKFLAKRQDLEFHWAQHWDSDGKWDTFCHMMPFYSYDVPHTCGPEPAICCQFDFERLPGHKFRCDWKISPKIITESNVEERARVLLDQYRKKSTLYKHNLVLIPLGDDFRYKGDDAWDVQYHNYRKLMDYMNNKPEWNVQIKFGTLSEYFREVEKRSGIQSSDKHPGPGLPKNFIRLAGDMFTYSDRRKDYWSGYYTSRPFFKRADRVVEEELRAAEIAFSVFMIQWRMLGESNAKPLAYRALFDKLTTARRNLALFQHHDGITGTSKTHVMEDYGQKLKTAISFSRQVLASSLLHLLSKNKKSPYDDSVVYVDDIDETLKAPKMVTMTGAKQRFVIVFNSLAQARQAVVTFHVDSPNVVVYNSGNQKMISQTEPLFLEGSPKVESKNTFLLHFTADMGPLSAEKFKFQVTTESELSLAHTIIYSESPDLKKSTFNIFEKKLEEFEIENSFTKLKFDPKYGLLKEYMDKASGQKTAISVQFMHYKGRNSGAYLFLPDGEGEVIQIENPIVRVVRGPLLQSVTLIVNKIEHVIRLFNSPGTDSIGLEIENRVDIRSEENFELSMRIVTDIENRNSEFYSDLNCFQFLRRKRWSKLPLQANVYPMPCGSFLEGGVNGMSSGAMSRVTLLSAQPLGVSSMQPGQLEVFLDRRLSKDDNRGLFQSVRDNKPTVSIFRMLLETLQESSTSSQDVNYITGSAHLVLNDLLHPMNRLVLSETLSVDVATSQILGRLTMMTGKGLPCDYHLVNLKTLDSDIESPAMILHRNKFHCGSPEISRSACPLNPQGRIYLSSLFNEVEVKKVKKMSLTLMHNQEEISGSGSEGLVLSIPPMELDAFKLVFV